MTSWIGIAVAFGAGIWGTIHPDGVLLFMFNKRYQKKTSQPSTPKILITRVICVLTLVSSVYLAIRNITVT
jgi:hypothetical protein